MSLGDETARTREALKAGVAASVHDLIEIAQQLVDRQRILNWVAGTAVLIAFLIAVFVGVNQFQLRHIAHQNRDNGNAIRDCTTPAGACYERSQAQTGTALSKLVLAFCSGLYPNDPAKAQSCGVAALKALRR